MQKKRVQLVSHRDNDHEHLQTSSRRPRADTMPTQSTVFPYSSSDAAETPEVAVIPSSAAIFRNRSGSITLPPLSSAFGDGIFNTWSSDSLQSPTTPTTDQLLKEDDGNTIASTLASLGLDDERDRRHTIHASHSYSSLHSWYQHHRPPAEPWSSNPSSSVVENNEQPPRSLMMAVASKIQSQRPRAISMSVADNRAPFDTFPQRSIWPPLRRQHHDATRPYLRSSNSSADLLEMMARQRRAAMGTPTGSAEHTADDWDATPSIDDPPSGKNSPASNAAQQPTRSLWLGNIDPALTMADLNCIFAQFGIIDSVRILPDRECAFVNFATIDDALRAKEGLMHTLNGRLGNSTVKVGFGKPEAVPQPPTCGEFGANAQGPTRALWIGNIPSTTTYSMLLSIFSPFGAIESVRVLTHKNCGFVNFESQEDAVRAKKALQSKEIMGPATGPVRIGFAKVPTAKAAPQDYYDMLALDPDYLKSALAWPSPIGNSSNSDPFQQQVMMYMMSEMMGSGSSNIYGAIASERQLLMSELGGTEDENDGPLFDEMHLPFTYFPTIAAAPELGQTRKIDIVRLRDIRKRLDTGFVSTKELEAIAVECLDEIVELCSDHIGNTVIQRLFERCSEVTKSRMLDTVAPYLASIGIHKNGTWAAQKIIDTGRLPSQINCICANIMPYVPALLLDQFGNYVVQCCLGLGPERNQFIFDAIVDNCWEIAQGRFGARAVRATLESPHVTKRQQKYVAATIVQHALLLATNSNGALLLIWLLDTSGIPGRYRVLTPRLTPHLARLCTHKLASLTILKIINQRHEPDARAMILDALVFSSSNQVIEEVLKDQVHGVNLIQKILSSSYVDLRERQRIADRIKQVLNKLKLQHVQGYKRLMEEINMVRGDSNPGASLGALPGLVPPSFAMNPEIAAAFHAKYMAAAAAAVAAVQPQQFKRDQEGQSGETSPSERDTTANVR
ncbi:armadillo-type protein [Fennellomyces sp. T-0311]|nr:armadillo-type protein [Fennellomyces sp. T-0311]